MRESEPIVVLGIDPGTAVTGYGVVRKDGHNALTLIECGVIRTKPSDALPQRLSDIHDGVVELPVIGEVEVPRAVLIRPDGYVAWAGDLSDPALPLALTTWFA